MERLIAYHGSEAEKAAIITQLVTHRAADRLVKGKYWEGGKGCAVGCTIHSSNHMEYESRFGIPVMLAQLEDCIFEGLPNDKAMEWPVRFMSAIKPGADLSLVGWKFLHWILTDETGNPGISHPIVKDAVAQAAQIICALSKGGPLDGSAARSAARSAAWSAAESAAEAARSAAWSAAESAAEAARSAAWSAARSAAEAAESARSARSAAESAVWSARSAAWSAAWSAAESAESARSAAEAARSAAWSAAESAAEAARSAAYEKMADTLIELIEAA